MSGLSEEIITRPQQMAACCEYLASCRQFGFDTEFVGEDSYHPRLCLIQVATAERLFLIDPLADVGPLDAFWQLVVDPAYLVVAHAAREEVRLCHLWTGKTPGNLFDLQLAAGLVSPVYPIGHGTLVGQMLGIPLSKGETLTEWRDRPLTRAQIRYAFDDVRYLLALWERLSKRLAELGRTEWACEEFARLAVHATLDEPATEKWRKLRGISSLDRRGLAIIRELFRWREQMAAQKNRPTRTIIRDDLLIEIARRNPRYEDDLRVVRGLPRRDLSAILHMVERVRDLPLEQCPEVAEREQDLPQINLVTNVLLAVVGDLCARLRLAPSLMATSHDIKLLVRAYQQGRRPPESLLTQGWRKEHVLPALLKVLEGRHSLRITDLSSEAPFSLEETTTPTAWTKENR